VKIAIAIACSALAGVVSTAAGQPRATRTIWEGVYSEAQAARGEKAYKLACGYCHRTTSPAVSSTTATDARRRWPDRAPSTRRSRNGGPVRPSAKW
jgi:cytochrome c5